jgi:outer membrane protein assembly factor BamB
MQASVAANRGSGAPANSVWFSSACSGLIVALAACGVAQAGDWPMWRGPHQNSVSDERGLVDEWNPKGGPGSNLVWRNPALGGRSTPVVLGDKLYTLVRDKPGTELEGEKVVCADAATGKVLWEHRFNVYLSDVPDIRVAWSSVVADPATGRVYAQGVCGYFCCLEGADGKLVWSRSLHEELGLISTVGGRTNFPLLYGDTVITSAVVVGWGDEPKWGLLAKPAHRFMAFDKGTGELRWLSGTSLAPYDTTYSTPSIATLGGVPALVFGSGDGGVWALQAGTGKPLWKCIIARMGVNVSPVVDAKGRVYAAHSEENPIGNTMGAVVAIDGNAIGTLEVNDQTGKELWKSYQMMVGKSSPLVVDGRVYAINDFAKLFVLDARTGKELSRKALGRVMRASPLYADGKIYCITNAGEWYILKPAGDGVKVVHKLRLGEEADASPIAAGGRIYVTTGDAIYCLAKDKLSKAAAPQPAALPAEPTDKRVAQAQLVPWDTLLGPGGKQKYTVRLFNAAGQYLRDAESSKVAFGVAGAGDITPQGEYTAPASAGHQASLVLSEVEGVSAQARVRVSPPLPWSFDFEDEAGPPLTWVGGRVRYVARKNEAGERYLAKLSELPTRPGGPTTKLGARSMMFMGDAKLANYTVQADFQLQEGVSGESAGPANEPAAATRESAIKLPSGGVINSGYALVMFGPNAELRLYSWPAHDRRTQAVEPMAMRAGVWYRLKLSVTPQPDGKATLVQGKAWLRGEPEPGEWAVEFQDDAPNRQGSPGLFGDTKEAEFFVDNLSVTPN